MATQGRRMPSAPPRIDAPRHASDPGSIVRGPRSGPSGPLPELSLRRPRPHVRSENDPTCCDRRGGPGGSVGAKPMRPRRRPRRFRNSEGDVRVARRVTCVSPRGDMNVTPNRRDMIRPV